MRSTITNIGIDAISFYTSRYYVDLRTVATERGFHPETFARSVGQEKMAVPPPGEDIVTMAANAAAEVLKKSERDSIQALFFATESGVDQSKAGGIWVHRLLGLPSRCRVVELKQACYSATAALQMAIPVIRQQPDCSALIIASDIARYGIGTPGEATQGGGAVAMLIRANPKIIAIDAESGYYTEDAMDFWRPNYLDAALVDGKASVRLYIKSLLETWRQYRELTGRSFVDFDRFCYHLPFTRMAETAHQKLLKSSCGEVPLDLLGRHIGDTLRYNRVIGNTYAASLYIALCSLLDHDVEGLDTKRIAFFSYGSGCTAEFFSGVLTAGYRDRLATEYHHNVVANRQALTYSEYLDFYNFTTSIQGPDFELPRYETGQHRLTSIKGHKRIYENIGDNS